VRATASVVRAGSKLKGTTMKTIRIIAIGSILALIGALAAGCAGTSKAEGSPGVLGRTIGKGAVTATVLHVETRVPLERIPVTVRGATKPGLVGTKPVLTNKAGIAEIGGLADGTYEALVIYNNHTSNIAGFKVSGGSHASITLFFNPDID
jgi:hypothetical protein